MATAELASSDAAGMVELLRDWSARYPIVTIEDGMDQNDRRWRPLTATLGERVTGGTTSCHRRRDLQRGIDAGVANSIPTGVNQIGTLSETFAAIEPPAGPMHGGGSHRPARPGRTIADIAAYGTGQIKTGSMSRSDRIAKYNRLLVIEQMLGDRAVYPGRKAFYNLGY